MKTEKAQTDEEKVKHILWESGNIFDALATKGSTKKIYNDIFHKTHDVEAPNDLTFRNVRFGNR